MKNVTRVLAGTKAIKSAMVMAAIGLAVFIAGCAPRQVPPFSQLAAEAPGQVASFQAPDDGTVYVVGPGRWASTRHLTYSGLIRRGEVVSIDPVAGKLTVNGKVQEATIETGKSYYQIWYQRIPGDIVGN